MTENTKQIFQNAIFAERSEIRFHCILARQAKKEGNEVWRRNCLFFARKHANSIREMMRIIKNEKNN